MSAQAVTGVEAGMPPGELAIEQRVQQLQALIESARLLSAGGVLSTGATGSAYSQATNSDFASALQAATGADADGVAEPAGIALTDPTYADYQGAYGTSGGEGGEYEAQIDQAAARNGLDPAVLHGLIQQESGFDPSAVSSAGASGLTQLMPGTAASLGVADPLNPAESIEGGARYLGELMAQFGGNTQDALAAYNAGPAAVEQYGGIPPYAETQSYVSNVLANAEAYRQSHPATATSESLA